MRRPADVSRATLAGLLALVLAGCAADGPPGEQSCSLIFEVVAENAVGGIAPGERLQGEVEFAVGSSLQQDVETLSYETTGRMRVAAQGRGAVTGQVAVVHVVRTPYIADYISIDASRVAGDLGGERSYADPMLVTLYAAPGSLASFDLPRDESAWSAPFKRMVFQVHTPTATEAFFGRVEALSGRCR